MRALANYLISRGVKVQGSDRESSKYTDDLRAKGARIFIGHSPESVVGAALVIRTAAIKDDNPEIVSARAHGIPVIERSEAWGFLMSRYPDCVCIAGTHGKTTTTAMTASVFTEAGKDPTVMVGGDMPEFGGTLRLGADETFVAEACEYQNSFLKFTPTVAVILNVDRDHMDFFKNTDDIINSFRKFASLVPEDGFVIANGDDMNVRVSTSDIGRETIYFGLDEKCDVRPENVKSHDGFYSFTVLFKGERYADVRLSVPGMHNMLNALAVAAVAHISGISGETFAAGINKYRGINRRMEFKKYYNGACVFDDYAHHPSEIEATLKAARGMNPKRIICVFQPHTYTRTAFFLEEFAKALSLADVCLMTEIYAAREQNPDNITSKLITDRIPGALYTPTFEQAAEYIKNNAGPGDFVFTMGAGDIYKLSDLF